MGSPLGGIDSPPVASRPQVIQELAGEDSRRGRRLRDGARGECPNEGGSQWPLGPLDRKTIENPWTFWENMFFVTKVSGDFQNWGLSNMGIYIYPYVTPIRLIHIHTHTHIHTYIHTNIHTYIHPSIHTYIHIYNIHIHIHIHRQTDRQTYIQTYRQTDIHTYVHTYIHTELLKNKHMHTHVQTWCIKWVVNCNFHTVVAKQVLSVGWSKVGWNIKNEVYVTYPRQLWHPIFIPMSRQSFWWDPHSFNEGPCSHITLMLLQGGGQWLVG